MVQKEEEEEEEEATHFASGTKYGMHCDVFCLHAQRLLEATAKR